MVPPLTGNETDYGRFLWEQNNEHRIPLPKLLYLLLLKISHGDFRSGMFFNIAALAGLSAILMQAAKNIRGKTIYTDAFLPVALLHLGHWGNLYWSWQIGFILPTVLTCIQFSFIVRYKKLLSLRQAMILSICTVLLPLCGANGLLYLLPIWPFLAYEATLHLKNKEEGANHRTGLLLLSSIALSLLITIAYFIGYVYPPWNPPNPGVVPTIKTFFMFLAMGLGPIASSSWIVFSLIATVFLLATGFVLLSAVTKTKQVAFRRACGILVFFGGYMAFAVAMGYGHAAWVPMMGMPIRYVLPAVPPLIVCYFSFELYGSQIIKKTFQWALFSLMVIFLYGNTRGSFFFRNWYVGSSNDVLRDIKAGVPESEIFKRHQPFLLHWNPQYLLERMRQLKKAGMGPFKDMKDDPSSAQELPLSK